MVALNHCSTSHVQLSNYALWCDAGTERSALENAIRVCLHHQQSSNRHQSLCMRPYFTLQFLLSWDPNVIMHNVKATELYRADIQREEGRNTNDLVPFRSLPGDDAP